MKNLIFFLILIIAGCSDTKSEQNNCNPCDGDKKTVNCSNLKPQNSSWSENNKDGVIEQTYSNGNYIPPENSCGWVCNLGYKREGNECVEENTIIDTDNDSVSDLTDNCLDLYNPLQENIDGDSFGDVCDDDIDGDNIINEDDDCPYDNLNTCNISTNPNDGWIGGECLSDSECEYDGSFCLTDYPSGMCSLNCSRYCPDSTDTNNSLTFCIENPEMVNEGICVIKCDYNLYPGTGCRDNYYCVSKERYNEAAVTKDVCIPFEEEPNICTENDFTVENVLIEEEEGLDGCPNGMTPINSTVCIDIYEAFVVEIDQYGNELPFSPYKNPGTLTIKAKSAKNAVPQGYINEIQAKNACLQAGKRLCLRTEWEFACKSSNNYTYPYGNTRQPGVCNDARSVHPVIEYFESSEDWIWSELGHPCINQLDNSLDKTGENQNCISECGAFDLMGNLHEWIDDDAGTFKGGYYVDTVINGNGCNYTTTAHNVSHWDYSTGFRCCADK